MDTPNDFSSGKTPSIGQNPAPDGPSRPAARDHSGLVTARGTGEGLVLRIDGRIDSSSLKLAVHEFVTSRRVFLEGNDVIIEWAGKLPDPNVEAEVSRMLSEIFSVQVKSTRLWEGANGPKIDSGVESPRSLTSGIWSPDVSAERSPMDRAQMDRTNERRPSLFDGLVVERDPARVADATGAGPLLRRGGMEPVAASGSDSSASFEEWDNADARIVYGTLRGGQKIESEHSVVVFGDLNFGAEVIAGGDVIVLGNLRGVAHAGAYDESGGGRVILALNMEPTQLRIGLVISRGQIARAGEERREEKGVELARVDGNSIVVEPFFSRQSVRSHSATSFVASLARKVTGRRNTTASGTANRSR